MIARRLAVIAGEDAEAPRVDRQALVQAELGAEIGDEIGLGIQVLADFPLRRRGHVGVQRGQRAGVVLQEVAVGGGAVQGLLGHPAQEQLGIVAAADPQLAIQPPEHPADVAVPGVCEIAGQLLEARELRRNLRTQLQDERGGAHDTVLMPAYRRCCALSLKTMAAAIRFAARHR
jgi:hypothetical protein